MESNKPKGGFTILQLLALLAVIGIVLTVVLNYLR
jgi:type II secretory pathway pseudopilin PulG